MGRKKIDGPIDWVVIEREYRLGQKSMRQLAQEFGVQTSAISRKSKAEEWIQDKSSEVLALSKAQLLISNREKATLQATPSRVDIEIAATVRTNVVLSHRSGLGKLCEVKDKLLIHLESVVDNFDDLADVIEMIRNPDDNGQDKANDRLKSMMGRSAVIDDLKKLAEVDEKVRKGQREAFGIDEKSMESPIDAALKRIAEAMKTDG